MEEDKLIKNIIVSSDWEEVITNLVIDEDMDPLSIDIINLTNAFVKYLETLKFFDFRVPARFILVAAILLRMKCDILLEEEKEEKIKETPQPINIDNIEPLDPPLKRKPVRKVKLDELVDALEKAFEFKEKKIKTKIRHRENIENVLEKEEEKIEKRMDTTIDRIKETCQENKTTFSKIVGEWKRAKIVYFLFPILELTNQSRLKAYQEELFKEIFLEVVDLDE